MRCNTMRCAHCDSSATIRTSRQMTPTCRELYFQCQNIECGHTFSAVLEVTRTIVPSQTPNPAVYIPQSTRSAQQPRPEAVAAPS